MASDYQKVLSQELSAAELAKLDAFFASSAGQKYVDAMINDEPLDKMTLEELEYMDHEVGTASINNVFKVASPANPRAKKILDPALHATFGACFEKV